jgi:hypothetical protein
MKTLWSFEMLETTHLSNNRELNPRRSESSSTPLWETQILQKLKSLQPKKCYSSSYCLSTYSIRLQCTYPVLCNVITKNVILIEVSHWVSKIIRTKSYHHSNTTLHSQKTLHASDYIIHHQATHRLNLREKCNSYCYIMIFVFDFVKTTWGWKQVASKMQCLYQIFVTMEKVLVTVVVITNIFVVNCDWLINAFTNSGCNDAK